LPCTDITTNLCTKPVGDVCLGSYAQWKCHLLQGRPTLHLQLFTAIWRRNAHNWATSNQWCMDMEILQSDWIRNFFRNSISNPYLKIRNCGLRYPIQIWNRPLSCTL